MDKLEDVTPKKCCHYGKGKIIAIIIVILIIIGAFTCWKYFNENGFNLSKIGINSTATSKSGEVTQAEIEQTLKAVSRHLLLPSGEVPQMATISNVEEMAKQQVFFAGAKNGDKLIVYMIAKKAIIYSPSRDIVVNVGPVFMNDQATAGGQSATQAQTSTSDQTSTQVTTGAQTNKATAPTKK